MSNKIVRGSYMLRNEYLACLSKVYENASLDYLLALRDGLSILIERRVNPGSAKLLKDYPGYVKYN